MRKKKKQKAKRKNKRGKEEYNTSEMSELLRNWQDFSPPKSYQIESLIKKFDNAVERFDTIVKQSRKWNITLVILTMLLSLLTLGVLYLGFQQLTIIKGYQDWSRSEMSRRPDLALSITQIDTLKDSQSLRLHCNLVNSGNDIAQWVQVRHRVVFLNDTLGNYFSIDVTGPSTGVLYFSDEDEPYVKIAIYMYAEIIYFEEDEKKNYELKLPWMWEIKHIPDTLRVIVIEYTIHSNRGSFKGNLIVYSPFLKK